MDQNAKRNIGRRKKRAPSVGFSPLEAVEAALTAFIKSAGTSTSNFGVGAQVYKDIFADISAGPNSPAAGVDVAVWDWFAGAVTVNEQSGFAGKFVADYTVDQYNLRTNNTTYSNSQFAIASDQLASVITAGIIQFGTLPASVQQV